MTGVYLMMRVALGVLACAFFPIQGQEFASIEGSVVQSLSRGADLPVAALPVTLVPSRFGDTVPGQVADSKFIFTSVSPGSYELQFGYSGFGVIVRQIVVAAGKHRKLPPIALEFSGGCPIPPHPRYLDLLPATGDAKGNVNGTVIDERGRSISSAEVFLYSRASGLVAWTSTDSMGRYRLDGMEPGRYWLRFRAARFYQDDWGDGSDLLVQAGFDAVYPPFALERCGRGRCDPSDRPIKFCE